MFMPETEDMLPRAAPRPSAPIPLGHVDEIVKPTVPEVSILFGQPPQQQAQMQQQQQHQPPQQQHQQPQQQSGANQRPAGSFASWKKQILPRVNFSPVLSTELGPGTQPPATSGGISNATACNEYNFLPRTRAFDAERTSPMQSNGYAVSGPLHYPRETFATEDLVQATRLPPSNAAANDVLTICASTQTEPEAMMAKDSKGGKLELDCLADKKDIREILTLLEGMRQEQQHLRGLYESLVQQQQLTSCKTFKDTGVQCAMVVPNKGNAIVRRIAPIVQDYIVEEEELPARVLPQFQSPRAAPPIAQSTGYRANTPQGKQSPLAVSKAPALSKPSTDKTLVMNELALKYLPQRQIQDLMDELHVSPKTSNENASNTGANTTPLRQIDNFTQSPNNMSNASYKYLKKYRLLPEEQLGYDHHMVSPQAVHQLQRTGSPAMASPQCQEPMLDLDNIRNQPKLL